MRLTLTEPPRIFECGRGEPIQIADCAHIELAPNEQVTFKTERGGEYDVVRKSWGFYATPSLNDRLQKFGLRAALVKSPAAKFYVFLVETGREDEYQKYLDAEEHSLVCWLDNDADLSELERKLNAPSNEN